MPPYVVPRTLGEIAGIEPIHYGPKGSGDPLTDEVEASYRTPPDQLTLSQLTTALQQNASAEHLVGRALNVVIADPMAEGTNYPGDVLHNLMGLNRRFWMQHDGARKAMLSGLPEVEEALVRRLAGEGAAERLYPYDEQTAIRNLKRVRAFLLRYRAA